MQPQSSDRPRPRGRWGWAVTILVLLFSLYPISLSARSGDWFSVALLVTLDLLMIAVRIVVARKLAALPPGGSNDPPEVVPGR
jgi:hypothetical protein